MCYLYIKAAKSFFNVPREKLSPRPLAAEVDNLKDVKGFRRQGVHTTFFVHPKICNYYKPHQVHVNDKNNFIKHPLQ
jgi:hypothetical protein